MTDRRTHELSNELVISAARLVRAVRRHTTHHPSATMRLLSLLDELGPATVGALAHGDRCSQPTMTGHVKGLVERGLVRRDPNPDDARSQLVSMTRQGRAALSELRRHNASLIAGWVAASGHSTDELASAAAVLRDVLDHAGQPTPGRPGQDANQNTDTEVHTEGSSS